MKTITSSVSPKQIEIAVELPDQWAHYRGSLIPQLDQVPSFETFKGIYRFESLDDGSQRLEWCFANSGKEAPSEFSVDRGSKRTMVTLERYEQTPSHSNWVESVVPSKLRSMLD